MRNSFERLSACTPVNVTAARVVARQRDRDRYVPDKKITCVHDTNPIPTKPVPAGVPDLTGRICGRLVVVGYLRDRGTRDDPAEWVVKCKCGAYETRRAKAIRKAHPLARCQQCEHVRYLKRQDYFKQHGKWPSVDWDG